MAAAAVVIYQGWAENLQTKVPGYAQWVQDAIEGSSAAQDRLTRLSGKPDAAFVPREQQLASRIGKVPLKDYGSAPEVHDVSAWINSRPLSLPELRGKVVLVDFWTYSCINCLRTLPHVKAWYRTYAKDGLVVLGVHTPEFAFEHVPSNVRKATGDLGVHYPVALDNDYKTWNAFHNQYWPAKYLIDRRGHLRFVHFGEGEYDTTEARIRTLLGENAGMLPVANELSDPTPKARTTPESYLGYNRLARFSDKTITPDRLATYQFPHRELQQDELSYAGRWRVNGEDIVAGPGARLRLRFTARNVHLVLGGRGSVRVLVDGRPVRTVRVRGSRLYTLADMRNQRNGLLELRFTPGVRGYAFTFG